MTSALFSNAWYRIADLRPRLRTQAKIVRHTYRGERWHVLQDMASGRFLRLNPAAFGVVAMFDGQRTLDEIWHYLCHEHGDLAPTQDEVVQLLTQLHQANVLVTDRPPDLEELGERRHLVVWQKLKQYVANPLSLKIPLYDPDRFLSWLLAFFPRGYGRLLFGIWLCLIFSGVTLAGMHWDELTGDVTARVFTPENVLLLWLAFPLLKALHELGHGVMLKALGGNCHETGLMFLLMVPVPYVDASSATAFTDKRHRMLVGAAGMMTELAVAAIAVWLWTATMPGVGRAFLHQVILLSGLTTIVFNINPLIRFDGYYILSDWLEIPNLTQKAEQYLTYLINRHVFNLHESTPPLVTSNEARWLVFYSIAAMIYRFFVAFAIILLVAGSYFFIGVLLALWSAWTMLLLPVWKYLRFMVADHSLDGRRQRVVTVTLAATGLLILFFWGVPAPSWTMAEGVIWMPEESRIRAPVACFGAKVLVKPGQLVNAGDALLSCVDPELDALASQLRERKTELDQRVAHAITYDKVQTQITSAELAHIVDRLITVEARQEAMLMRSPHGGEFVMSAPEDFEGKYLARGDVAAYVLDPTRYTLLAVVPQSDVDLVRRHTVSVELRSVDRIWDVMPAQVVREVPAATNELPSLALSLAGGGKIGLDPNAKGGGEPRSLAPLFQFELTFTGEKMPRALGNRVYVRFVHHAEPLASQWYRNLRQLFLKRFSV